MEKLYNIYPKKQLKLKILNNPENRITISFYKYFNIHDPLYFRNIIYKIFYILKIFGRIYIAKEGINAQISILLHQYDIFKEYFYKIHSSFKNIKLNKSLNHKQSFWMLKVKVRKKIIADGLLDNTYHLNNVGRYLKAHDVNNMWRKPNVVFVDMRNDYEYEIGHFKNAIHIPGSTFRDQLKIIVNFLKKYKNNIIVMYCTGGIRCEKATAWIKYHGFNYVYQIEGGIINYINQAKKNDLLVYFQGKNFVFDNRMAERISNHILSKCKNCNCPCDDYTNCEYDYCHDLVIQCKMCNVKYHGCCSIACKNLILKK